MTTVVEVGSKVVKIYNSKSEIKHTLEPTQSRDVSTFVLAATHSDSENLFGCTTSDKKIYFWEGLKSNLKPYKVLSADNVQTNI